MKLGLPISCLSPFRIKLIFAAVQLLAKPSVCLSNLISWRMKVNFLSSFLLLTEISDDEILLITNLGPSLIYAETCGSVNDLFGRS